MDSAHVSDWTMSRVCDMVWERPAQLYLTSKYCHKLFQEGAVNKKIDFATKIYLAHNSRPSIDSPLSLSGDREDEHVLPAIYMVVT